MFEKRPITAYVINLKSNPERKEYMERVLYPFPFIKPVFIEAVDGREMRFSELENTFDQAGAYRRYGRMMSSGEVGCTLSHLECCKKLLESGEDYAIVFEDDLVLRNNPLLEDALYEIAQMEMTDSPAITILNGDYWYLSKSSLNETYSLAKVFDAVCAGAYMINVAAAKKLLEMGPDHIADDWRSIKKHGIALFASYPHMGDQNRLDFKTTIANSKNGKTDRKNLKLASAISSYFDSGINRFLKLIKHFENKDFVW